MDTHLPILVYRMYTAYKRPIRRFSPMSANMNKKMADNINHEGKIKNEKENL